MNKNNKFIQILSLSAAFGLLVTLSGCWSPAEEPEAEVVETTPKAKIKRDIKSRKPAKPCRPATQEASPATEPVCEEEIVTVQDQEATPVQEDQEEKSDYVSFSLADEAVFQTITTNADQALSNLKNIYGEEALNSIDLSMQEQFMKPLIDKSPIIEDTSSFAKGFESLGMDISGITFRENTSFKQMAAQMSGIDVSKVAVTWDPSYSNMLVDKEVWNNLSEREQRNALAYAASQRENREATSTIGKTSMAIGQKAMQELQNMNLAPEELENMSPEEQAQVGAAQMQKMMDIITSETKNNVFPASFAIEEKVIFDAFKKSGDVEGTIQNIEQKYNTEMFDSPQLQMVYSAEDIAALKKDIEERRDQMIAKVRSMAK